VTRVRSVGSFRHLAHCLALVGLPAAADTPVPTVTVEAAYALIRDVMLHPEADPDTLLSRLANADGWTWDIFGSDDNPPIADDPWLWSVNAFETGPNGEIAIASRIVDCRRYGIATIAAARDLDAAVDPDEGISIFGYQILAERFDQFAPPGANIMMDCTLTIAVVPDDQALAALENRMQQDFETVSDPDSEMSRLFLPDQWNISAMNDAYDGSAQIESLTIVLNRQSDGTAFFYVTAESYAVPGGS
jgi:hypothetical protein